VLRLDVLVEPDDMGLHLSERVFVGDSALGHPGEVTVFRVF
jgi:hypothetical protein